MPPSRSYLFWPARRLPWRRLGHTRPSPNLAFHFNGACKEHYAQLCRYLSWAAAAGDEAAMGQLGHMHAGGQGTPVDLAQARAWFERGAAAGSASATFGLGYMHFSGVGAPQVIDH